MNKAIFLGSFNPPHIGHYNVIKTVLDSDIMNRCNIDCIHVIPCKQNPNKNNYNVSYTARYNMCEMMFKDLINTGKVVINDIENKISPEYTYDLIKYIKSGDDKSINKDFWWIITTETLDELISCKWYKSIPLICANRFIVLVKNDKEIDYFLRSIDWDNKQIHFVKLENNYDIHSTDIRNNFWVNAKYDDCITQEIKNYIIENNLYK